MFQFKIIKGELYVPKRAESKDGRIIGDALLPVKKDDPDYEKWMKQIKEKRD